MIADSGKGDDLVKAKPKKPVFERRARRLGCIALTPVRPRQPPGDFDCRRKRHRPAQPIEPDRSDKPALARQLDDELAEAMLIPMPPRPGGVAIATMVSFS